VLDIFSGVEARIPLQLHELCQVSEAVLHPPSSMFVHGQCGSCCKSTLSLVFVLIPDQLPPRGARATNERVAIPWSRTVFLESVTYRLLLLPSQIVYIALCLL
jgi:hypothetical protein